jgi:hypothetical protein
MFTLSSGFTVVDSDGNLTQQGELGLLLFDGGTVCDNSDYLIDTNAANAICRSMG